MTCFWGPVNGHRSWSCWYRSDGFTFPPSIDEVLHPCSQTAVIWYLLSSYYVHRLRFCVRKCYTWSDTHRAHHIEPDIELKKVNSQYKWSDLRPRIRLGAVVLAKKSRSEIRLLQCEGRAMSNVLLCPECPVVGKQEQNEQIIIYMHLKMFYK